MALPQGWTHCPLVEANIVIAGQSPESKYYNEDGNGLPFFQGKADFGQLYPTNRVYCTEPKKVAKSGDILLSVRAPVGPTNLARETVSIGRGLNAIRPLGGILARYVLYFFKQIEPVFSGQGTGTTFSAVTVDAVKNLDFPLPPLAEQHRIVAKIDALFSELDKGVEVLQTVRQQLRTYRQAVLKWAFEGKLTEEWRKTHIYSKEFINGAFMSSARKECSRINACGIDTEFPIYDIPNDWAWISVGSLSKGIEYGTSAKSEKSGKVVVLRMGNIQNCSLVYDDLAYSNDDAEIEKYLLIKNDVLFNRTNSSELVGKTAIYNSSIPSIFAGYLMRVNQISYINASYLNYYLNSPNARKCGKIAKTDGVNQANINGKKLARYPFPLCSDAEQAEIVSAIESRLSVCDKLEQIVDENLAKAQALRQSILKRAFAGELVPQDPNDEPAEKLLERIKAEKATAATQTTSARRKRK